MYIPSLLAHWLFQERLKVGTNKSAHRMVFRHMAFPNRHRSLQHRITRFPPPFVGLAHKRVSRGALETHHRQTSARLEVACNGVICYPAAFSRHASLRTRRNTYSGGRWPHPYNPGMLWYEQATDLLPQPTYKY